MKSRDSRLQIPRLAAALLVACLGSAACASDPSALWHIVHGRCVPGAMERHDPAPCAEVDLARGDAVLKDLRGQFQYLLIPTTRISGIEDPRILAPDAPNYWLAAWQARVFLEQRAERGVPRDDLSLAINSSLGRTQDQLHIHIDCVRPDVREALRANQDAIGLDWAPFPVPLAGQTYRAMRIDNEVPNPDPFRLLARSIPHEEIGWHTLVLVGAMFGGRPGFVLLDGRANLAAGNLGSGEALQDHGCAVLQ